MAEQHHFQAEIKQLLHILIHSLYKDREIFIRELISNASDALSKLQFEMLTNQTILDPDEELRIELYPDPEANTLRIVDTGVGMTHDEVIANLGIIAKSGAREFLERIKASGDNAVATDLIGQFGVGFYSVFMAADRVEVTSRSYQPEAEAITWLSSGEDSYEVLPADKQTRGTEILIHLREEATEYANAWKLREIIKRHSDYVQFPIYLITPPQEGETEPKREVINQQTAIWRRPSSEVKDEDYNNFFRMLTMDFEEPLFRIHSQGDAPIQYYALLYIPAKVEKNILSARKEPGLKLYARKILIQEYTTALLPEYLQFVQGVVDSEDIPLNVSRETVQANALMTKLKQTLTRRLLLDLGRLAENDQEKYETIWEEYSNFFKHGVVTEFSDRERLLPLLRFHTDQRENWISLDDYVERMQEIEGQDKIYYILADSESAAAHSPHLDPFRERGIEVLYLTDPVDGFLVNTLHKYKEHDLVSVDASTLDLEGVGKTPEAAAEAETVEQSALDNLIIYLREMLGERVETVRESKVLSSGSAVRLVAPEGSMDRHTQRVYRMLDKDYETPARIMEVNPRHPIIRNLAERVERNMRDDFLEESAIVLYENALLAEGLHPNPAELASHVQRMMEAATRLNGS